MSVSEEKREPVREVRTLGTVHLAEISLAKEKVGDARLRSTGLVAFPHAEGEP